MTILKPPWLGPVLTENFTLFQLFQVANPYLRHAGFTPVGNDSTGHMLEVIIIEKEDVDEDKLMEDALEAGAADFIAEDECFEIYTEKDDLGAVREALEEKGYTMVSAELDMIPQNYVTLEGEEDLKKMNLLLEHLEDNDDVSSVFHNCENCD